MLKKLRQQGPSLQSLFLLRFDLYSMKIKKYLKELRSFHPPLSTVHWTVVTGTMFLLFTTFNNLPDC